MRSRCSIASLVLLCLFGFPATHAFAQFVQQGQKLVGTGAVGDAERGNSVAISADGNTALVGGTEDNDQVGAVWVWTRAGGVWTQQGNKLVPTGSVTEFGQPEFGAAVALSADGNTAIVGAPNEGLNPETGAVWVFTRTNGVWTQQGSKLVGSGALGNSPSQGESVDLSADGNTAIVGGLGDNNGRGAAWIWTRTNGVWTQQAKLVGSGFSGSPFQGQSVAISVDGNTAIVGGPGDGNGPGAVWIWTRSGSTWTQQGNKLVGTGASGLFSNQGQSVALASDGNTAIVGAPDDNNGVGASWVFTRTGSSWAQQGSKLVGSGVVGTPSQGDAVTISGDGNTVAIGGPSDNSSVGATWIWKRSGTTWTQQGQKLVGSGSVDDAEQGTAVALSTDGATLIIGGSEDNFETGAAWIFVAQTVTSLTASPTSLKFSATKAGLTGALLQVTPNQKVSVSVAGPAPPWSASSNQTWLQITNGSGTGSGQLIAGIVNPSNVIAGSTSLSAEITVTAGTLTAKVTVTLTVDLGGTSSGAKAPPFGSFDTPANNAINVIGSIAVTGWALDDIGVLKVQIWRNCIEAIDRPAGACAASVPGGPANFVYIGDAAFLAGARNDVETQNPTLPQAYRGGWGYLMSTNALPHLLTGKGAGGEGTFTLYAYAVDVEGQYFQLGTKTISVDNDHATVPFGSLDTPEQGGLMTTSAYASFGWAMTQQPKNIDVTSTASYKVYIDGVSLPLVPGVNWFPGLTRPDIAGAYPGLKNTDNALAAYYIDATALGLSNGLHTTGWDVIDDKGNVAGIGSRFFNVLLGSALTSQVNAATARPAALGHTADLAPFSPAARDVRLQTGGDEQPMRELTANSSGRYDVHFNAGSRMALDLGGPLEAGYQQVGDELRALPPGATFDADAGTFAWQPPAPFFGPFRLAFVSGNTRVDVTATITDPTVSAGIDMHIDLPTQDASVGGSFIVAGWAIDPLASSGSGIDTLHVWAYRRDGVAAPQFLGAAAVGGLRPDVGAVQGDQFERAGFSLTTSSLAPGVYDILVYPWSHRTGHFEGATAVRVTVR